MPRHELPISTTDTRRDVCLRSTVNVCLSKRRSCFQTFAPLRPPGQKNHGYPPWRGSGNRWFPWKWGVSLRWTTPAVNGTSIFSPNVCHRRMRSEHTKDARPRNLDSLRNRIVDRALESFVERVPARHWRRGIRAFRANCAQFSGVLLNECPTRESLTMRGVTAARFMDSCTPHEGLLCAENCPPKSRHSFAK